MIWRSAILYHIHIRIRQSAPIMKNLQLTAFFSFEQQLSIWSNNPYLCHS